MNNALFVIEPYQWNGIWVFDDPRVGLVQEPFVSGMPEIIELAVREIPDAADGFVLIFSADPFPGATVELEWAREEMGGNWYRWNGMEGWLCPALFRYFESAPPKLYAQVRPKPRPTTIPLANSTRASGDLPRVPTQWVDGLQAAIRAG